MEIDLPKQNAKKALEIYQDYINQIKDLKKLQNEFHKSYSIYYSKKKNELKNVAENMPKSYIDFVTNNGLFSIGKIPDFELLPARELFSALTKQKEDLGVTTLKELSYDMNGLSETKIQKLENIFLFARLGHEYYGFDKRSFNADTGEMNHIFFMQDDGHIKCLFDKKVEKCTNKGFDFFVAEILTETLDSILKNPQQFN